MSFPPLKHVGHEQRNGRAWGVDPLRTLLENPGSIAQPVEREDQTICNGVVFVKPVWIAGVFYGADMIDGYQASSEKSAVSMSNLMNSRREQGTYPGGGDEKLIRSFGEFCEALNGAAKQTAKSLKAAFAEISDAQKPQVRGRFASGGLAGAQTGRIEISGDITPYYVAEDFARRFRQDADPYFKECRADTRKWVANMNASCPVVSQWNAFAELQDQAKVKPKPKTLRLDLVEALRSCELEWIAKMIEVGGGVVIESIGGYGCGTHRQTIHAEALDAPREIKEDAGNE